MNDRCHASLSQLLDLSPPHRKILLDMTCNCSCNLLSCPQKLSDPKAQSELEKRIARLQPVVQPDNM
jgi:hypothetical protein